MNTSSSTISFFTRHSSTEFDLTDARPRNKELRQGSGAAEGATAVPSFASPRRRRRGAESRTTATLAPSHGAPRACRRVRPRTRCDACHAASQDRLDAERAAAYNRDAPRDAKRMRPAGASRTGRERNVAVPKLRQPQSRGQRRAARLTDAEWSRALALFEHLAAYLNGD